MISARGAVVDYSDLLEEILDLVREDAEFFGCTAEVEHTRTIVKRGTSADRQLKRYEDAIERGESKEEALRAVVDGLIEETMAGVEI